MRRVLLLVTLAMVFAVPAAAALESSGRAVIVDQAGNRIARGATRDVFTIELPKGAECQGDSQDGGYRVESFLLPVRHDPGSMKWGELAPTAAGSFALYDTATNPYVHQLTGVAAEKGGPGPIVNTAQFSFGVFVDAPQLLASGRYYAGLACSRFDDTTRYWATEVRIDVDATRPVDAMVQWEVLTPVGTDGSSTLPTYALAGAVALIGVIVVSRRRSAKQAAAVAVVLVVALGVVTTTSRPAFAAEAAAATIVSADTKEPLTKGDKTTPFTLRLPVGAACAGDSANDGYRVQSYHVPESVDASTLRFAETGPQPTGLGDAFRQPLFATNANPYVHAQTAPATPAPGPGTVINVPAFDFAQYKPDMMRAGHYKVGLACARPDGSIERVWETAIELQADGSWVVPRFEAAVDTKSAAAAEDDSAAGALTPTATQRAVDDSPRADAASDAAVPTGEAPSMRVMVGGTVGAPATVPSQLLLLGAALVALRIGFLARRSVR